MAEKRLATSHKPIFREALIGGIRHDYRADGESEPLIVS
jgi:hypothetical protein